MLENNKYYYLHYKYYYIYDVYFNITNVKRVCLLSLFKK